MPVAPTDLDFDADMLEFIDALDCENTPAPPAPPAPEGIFALSASQFEAVAAFYTAQYEAFFADEAPAPARGSAPLAAIAEPEIAFKAVADAPTWAPREYRWLVRGDGARARNDADVLEVREADFGRLGSSTFAAQDEVTRRNYVFGSAKHFIHWFSEPNRPRTLHEVIPGSAIQRMKFDLDAPAAELATLAAALGVDDAAAAQALFDAVMEAIDVTFFTRYGSAGYELEYADFSMTDATDVTKFSRHIVISRYAVANYREAKAFTTAMVAVLPAHFQPFVDQSVNARLHNFRLPGCHKATAPSRVKRVYRGTAEGMIVTMTDDAILLPELVAPREDRPAELAADEAAVLALAGPVAGRVHEYRGRAGNVFLFGRLCSSYCEFCEHDHDTDNTMIVTVSRGHAYVRCRRAANDFRHIGDIPMLAVAEVERVPLTMAERIARIKRAKIPRAFARLEYNEAFLRPYSFADGIDTLLIRSGMGTGKSKQLGDLIRKLRPDIGVIFVSFRRSFTAETLANLGPDFVNYIDHKGALDAHRMVVQFESLHRVTDRTGPFLLVLDESESVISQIESPTMHDSATKKGTLRECWARFERLVRDATKLIAMDAYADARTYALLSERKHVLAHFNAHIARMLSDIHYAKLEDWLDATYRAIDNAAFEPVVIIASSKTQAKAIAARAVEQHGAARVRLYTGESTAAERKDFDNVNDAWADIDVLIYNSVITAGCSFERVRFTRLFAYFSSNSVDVNTACQMMGRVRDISTAEYHIHVKRCAGGMPNTRAAMERYVASKDFLGNLATNPIGALKMLNAAGEYEYRNKDLYHRLHVLNLLHVAQSKNDFEPRLRALRVQAGAVATEYVSTMDDIERGTIHAQNAGRVQEQIINECARIAHAAPLNAEEADDFAARRDALTRDERAQLEAHHLTRFYEMEPGTLTVPFVESHGRERMKGVWRQLRRLRDGSSIVGAVEARREYHGARDLIDGEDRDMYKAMAAVDVLTGLFGRDYVEHGHFEAATISAAELTERLPAVVDGLREHAELISMAFSVRCSRIAGPRDTTKSAVDLVNTILGLTYGVGIRVSARDGRRRATRYRLVAPNGFAWIDGADKYVVA